MTTQALTKDLLLELNSVDRVPALARVLAYLATVVTYWSIRSRTRKHLAAVPDCILRDIGLTPGQAKAESRKPFWQL